MYAPRRATWGVLCEKTDSDYFLRALETRAEPERRLLARRQMIRDLDEQFASERIKMAQLTNKCSDDDLEYFVKECGDIMGLSQFVS